MSPILQLRPLGFQWETADPFLFCVHHLDRYPRGNERLGPAASLQGRHLGQDFEGQDGWRMYHGQVVPGFPQHPHRGFETVTIVRQGLVDHSDSLGAAARLGPGDVQWITAGGGIVHSEMFPLVRRAAPNPCELFQLWLNLPAAQKLVPAHFTMMWGEQVPKRRFVDAHGRGTEVAVIAGEVGGAKALAPPPSSWASRPEADVGIWSVAFEPGAQWTLPPAKPGTHRVLYAFAGEGLEVAGEVVPPRTGVWLTPEAEVPLKSLGGGEALLLQGRPVGEPVAQHGPFVMNTRAELQQAFDDYRRTGFGGWPWPRDDPHHGATEGRFARHADGRVERPR